MNIDAYTKAGDLFKGLNNGILVCTACGHRCKLLPNQRGICKVRFNQNGTLKVPFYYVAGIHNDPIEKKPFFHVLPGSKALSFGMLGCDFHCAYCQNWFTSQSFRDKKASSRGSNATPSEICNLAEKNGSQTLISTYNEPLITSEWAVEVFREAKSRDLATGYVSNGHGTSEVLEYLHPWLDLFKIDLKGFDAKKYRRLGGNLDEVLETICQVHLMGFWTEIVTLVIPEYNDSDKELIQIAEFIASVSLEIPWHITGFHPDYKMTDRSVTSVDTLLRARSHGKKTGLKFIYCGNRPGMVENTENTFCPNCGKLLVERKGFNVIANHIDLGSCPSCHETISGRWNL